MLLFKRSCFTYYKCSFILKGKKMEKNNQNIQLAAYYLWQNSGCPEGRSEEFWYAAINQIDKDGCSCSKKYSSKSSCNKKASTSSCKKAKKQF